ncbi:MULTISPECIES: hypothetical protein [unclassified Novosphingobium]|uniref:hypothetical protein n=1 Tax=unclassified Novosphingobium TaxID=2644732 RepID=UPI0025D857C1|nr:MULTISPECIES: hypothetical protein [unclassified Novosphingobium]HQV03445.1 hypothetical protein [Novosphingobium sp.]
MNQADEALAKKRFMAISLIRLSGAVFMTLGLLVLGGKVDLPQAAGLAFVVIGLIDLLVAPVFLSRRWKSPRP